MTIPESYGPIAPNVWNNNNIATRNMWLTQDLDPFRFRMRKSQLIIANAENVAQLLNFEFANERSVFQHFAGDFSSLGSATLRLGNLYDDWVQDGAHGSVAAQDPINRTVTFDGANTLRLDSIPFTANQRYTIDVEFTLDSGVVVEDTSTHTFFAREYKTSEPDVLYGGGDYQIRIIPGDSISNFRVTPIDSIEFKNSFKISPNPTDGIVNIKLEIAESKTLEMTVTDMAGKKLMKENLLFAPGVNKEINLSRFASGTYIINLKDNKGKIETYKVIRK